MRAHHADKFLEGLQSRAHGRIHPLTQQVLGAFLLPVFPEQLEGFFQVVSADDGTVPPHQRGKAFFLLVGQVPRIFEQLSCLSWKWRKRSSVKINGRTYEERA